jgi:hypothetical protein
MDLYTITMRFHALGRPFNTTLDITCCSLILMNVYALVRSLSVMYPLTSII